MSTEAIIEAAHAEEAEPDLSDQAEHDAETDHEEEEEAEAETAEGESPDGEPVSERMIEEQYRKLARSATTWRNAVSRILGEQANELYTCPMCDPATPGFFDAHAIEHPANELQERLFASLAAPSAPEYREAPNATRCQTCDGYGRTRSGSQKPQNELIDCIVCSGLGYMKRPGYDPAPAANGAPAVYVAPQTPDAPVQGDVDSWGIPRLLGDGQPNPNYGRAPQYWDPSYPTGNLG